jgi:hypothetical protein
MVDDYYRAAGNYRWNQLGRVIAQELINADRHKEQGDLESLSLSLQVVANAKAEQLALSNLHNEVMAAEQVNTPRQLTKEELDAKDISNCSWEDSWRWISQNEKDPQKLAAMSEGFKAGMERVRKEKMGGR